MTTLLTAWHAQSSHEVVEVVRTDPDRGLNAADAAQRLLRDGPNRFTARASASALKRFLSQLAQPLVAILLGAAALKLVLNDPIDAAVIGAVVLLNAVIGFFQESRAEQSIAALDKLVVTEATVIRDGEKRRIPTHELVVGDIVALQSGDGVPADLRLLSVRELQIEEAALTGESVPTQKNTPTLAADVVLGDRGNMAFAGTSVTYGTGTGVVVATGDRTETGKIAGLLASVAPMATPLTRRIESLSRLFLWVILAVAAALFGLEAARGAPWADAFDAAVALAVGAIPEGLPAAVTVLLAVGVSTMARRGALIRRLPAVETLGSTTVICSDKTGTLTENQMTAVSVWTLGGSCSVSGIGYDQPGELAGDATAVTIARECLLGAALCSDTRLVTVADRTKVEGDPTEAALLVAARKASLSNALNLHRRLDVLPFESQHMYMGVLTEDASGLTTWVKGSSDALLKRCAKAVTPEGTAPMHFAHVVEQVEQLAHHGLRVLVVAKKLMDPTARELTHAELDEGLIFVGLVGIIDPPRPEAKKAIASCQRAGIRVKMITGDHASTAAAIATELGIAGKTNAAGELETVTGQQLSTVDDHALVALADEVAVFARVAPEQKLRLVRALQAKGHVVAMTGDGVNDAPALKQADLGVAMGRAGTDVARRAAAMILTDDNFATIAAAVQEGRSVFLNLVKFLAWSLPTNGAQGFTLLLAVAIGVDLPILPAQMLWVNMTTAVLIGTALIFEPQEPALMDRPPRSVSTPLLDGGLLARIIFVSALSAGLVFAAWHYSLRVEGEPIGVARTVAVNAIVVVGVAYLFACRSLTRPLWHLGLFSNPWVWWGSFAMLASQLLFTYAPFMQLLFHTEPISWVWWLRVSVAGVIVLTAAEAIKLWAASRIKDGKNRPNQPAQ